MKLQGSAEDPDSGYKVTQTSNLLLNKDLLKFSFECRWLLKLKGVQEEGEVFRGGGMCSGGGVDVQEEGGSVQEGGDVQEEGNCLGGGG